MQEGGSKVNSENVMQLCIVTGMHDKIIYYYKNSY
jgi:hypothetical protein